MHPARLDGDGMTADLIETLGEFGLSKYEAECLVALVGVEEATASEVSDLAGMPRSRVYDTAEALQRRGFIEVQESETTRYRSVAVERITDLLGDRYASLVEAVDDQLSELEVRSGPTGPDQGVWTVRGRDSVLGRTQELIEEAEREVFLTAPAGDLFDERCYECLERAADRGVEVRVVSMDGAVRETLRQRVPGATVTGSATDWLGLADEDASPGRILMVDRERVLIATVGRRNPLGGATWRAVWGSGSDNGFVVVLRAMLAWHIDAAFADE